MDILPNNIAFITGVSSGIGYSLVHKLLDQNYFVFGIGRNNSIRHKNYNFIHLDLSRTEDLTNFEFPLTKASSFLLINNAGTIGEIAPVGDLNDKTLIDVMVINTISSQILTNKFIKKFLVKNFPLKIFNISSGAAKRPIDAWATYCASKAAIDLFSETIKLEMNERQVKNFIIHSISPGVVDTQMQSNIRNASVPKFKASQRFQDLKKNNELQHPDFVAEKIVTLVLQDSFDKPCLLNLGDI